VAKRLKCLSLLKQRSIRFLRVDVAVVVIWLFVGLTAYDTQCIKNIYLNIDSPAVAGKKAIMGALALYLDFLNLFILLMQFTDNRRN
jgi:hypothetical protein